jgi:hypothetical protein
MLRCWVGHGQETEQQRADYEPSEDEPLTRRQQHHRLGLETDAHTPVVAIEVLASGSLSVLLYPRLASLAGLAAHLLDDVVTADQRLLRFKDLGPKASRPPTCLWVPDEGYRSNRNLAHRLGVNAFFCALAEASWAHRTTAWSPGVHAGLAALPAAESVASRSKKKLGTPPLDRSDQRSFRDHGGILSGNRIATVSARTPLASRP